ncbi:sodium/proline symporter PutP [Candidatus Thiosymbion oneisti]|uniref:sodium/proline symporter PutP n=1 Tax=Candidatus Thiosymbion oneisti TaxID=589554 RepID=UPI000A56DABC|nr:sodium/proline symporter PutP [Candidatus Thiosymbion oneisti]
MKPDPVVIALTFGAYFMLVLVIGWYAFRRTANLTDFILGGRRLGGGTAALSAGASDMSGWLLLGLPGLAYATGVQSLWLAGGLLLGTWLNWLLLAKRLRVFSEAYGNALTLPEFLANRFGDEDGWLRGISAFFILLFFLIYTGSGLVAGGKLFASVFGLPYLWAVAAGASVILLYTAVGGFLAVSWTDVLQGLLMAAALVAVPVMAFGNAGGLGPGLTRIEAVNPDLFKLFTEADGTALGLLGILSLAAWGLGYFGQPHILARFQAIGVVADVGKARRIAVSWVTITLTGAILAGLAGVLVLDAPLTADDRERVFIELVNLLFHPVLAGICLAAILAAIMSTADSQLLVSSSAFTEDLYRARLRPEAGPRELVAIGRGSVVILAGLAFIMALDPETMVLDLVGYAWAGFGAAFGPVVILSLYWPRMTRRGALAGIITGGITVVVWQQIEGGLFDVYELLPGFLLSLAAIWIASVSDPAPRAGLAAGFKQALGNLSLTSRQ